MVGRTISHYKILEKLGQGGMGVVYRAEDAKLARPVALKFLPPHLLSDDALRKRFEREAKSAAAVSHSNVCHVYEIDEVDDKAFIAMELIEGEPLDKLIAKGPLKLDQALDIARQVTQGLQAAHKRGAVHRDIKPENIMVGDDGHVTIMDFGLAQLNDASRLTRTDETVGTVAYMSPEQTDGSGTDHRTDIWSLGVVLYEMVTGQQPFKGDYDKAVMYSILNEEPEPITALRTGVAVQVEALVGKCLAKAPEDRCQHAGDLMVDLRAALKHLESGTRQSIVRSRTTPAAQTALPPTSAPGWLAFAALGGLCVLMTGLALYFGWRAGSPTERPVRHFTIEMDRVVHRTTISPDGRYLAYVVSEDLDGPPLNGSDIPGALWIRDLHTGETRQIEEAGDAASAPFWSPDSTQVAYDSDRGLLRTAVAAGATQTVSRQPGQFIGGSWSPDGQWMTISLGTPSRLFRVPADGGELEPLALNDTLDPEQYAGNPLYAFGAERPHLMTFFLYDIRDQSRKAYLLDWKTGLTTEFRLGNRYVFTPGGHWVFERPDPAAGWQLLAARGKIGSSVLEEEPFVFSQNSVYPTIANDGTLSYVSLGKSSRRLVWVNRQGERLSQIGQPQDHMAAPRLSRDGERVAVSGTEAGEREVWLHEADRPVKTRLTTATGVRAAWSPDGARLAFVSTRDDMHAIYVKPTDGGGPATRIFDTPDKVDTLADWSHDGRHIVFDLQYRDTWRLQLSAEGEWKAFPFVAGERSQHIAVFSPDDQYVAYVSNESGRNEIYVKPFPSGRGKWQVSEDGGAQPRWEGDEIFYVNSDALYAARISVEGGFQVVSNTVVFRDRSLVNTNPMQTYDVTPDGQRFVLMDTFTEGPASTIHIVQNWEASLKGDH